MAGTQPETVLDEVLERADVTDLDGDATGQAGAREGLVHDHATTPAWREVDERLVDQFLEANRAAAGAGCAALAGRAADRGHISLATAAGVTAIAASFALLYLGADISPV